MLSNDYTSIMIEQSCLTFAVIAMAIVIIIFCSFMIFVFLESPESHLARQKSNSILIPEICYISFAILDQVDMSQTTFNRYFGNFSTMLSVPHSTYRCCAISLVY